MAAGASSTTTAAVPRLETFPLSSCAAFMFSSSFSRQRVELSQMVPHVSSSPSVPSLRSALTTFLTMSKSSGESLRQTILHEAAAKLRDEENKNSESAVLPSTKASAVENDTIDENSQERFTYYVREAKRSGEVPVPLPTTTGNRRCLT